MKLTPSCISILSSFLLICLQSANASVTCKSPQADASGFGSCSYQGLGGMGASSPEEACTGNIGTAYNMCMCAASSAVIKW
jgi:hypothetical protein